MSINLLVGAMDSMDRIDRGSEDTEWIELVSWIGMRERANDFGAWRDEHRR